MKDIKVEYKLKDNQPFAVLFCQEASNMEDACEIEISQRLITIDAEYYDSQYGHCTLTFLLPTTLLETVLENIRNRDEQGFKPTIFTIKGKQNDRHQKI